jgi:heat-inducible transcriptional repressor
MPELNHRARKILGAVIQEYLATGDAVGSRTITRRGVDLSAATVRNVMADLEEAGLLKQPHTSAGRVPTDLGLRFFVDSLLKVRSLSPREREEVRARYDFSSGELDSALRETGRALSDLSQQTVVVALPRAAQDVLEHLEFMRLPSGALLAVLVTRSGHVENKIVHPGFPVVGDELEQVNNFLNERLGRGTLAEVRAQIADELASERTTYDSLAQRALELSQSLVPEAGAAHVIIEGQARLLEQTDVADVDKTKALFRALEEKEKILALLEKTEVAEGLQVFIGAEAQIDELTDFSVVAASYGAGDRPLGTLGVIGPTRMNYSKVIALVDFTAQMLSNMIEKR